MSYSLPPRCRKLSCVRVLIAPAEVEGLFAKGYLSRLSEMILRRLAISNERPGEHGVVADCDVDASTAPIDVGCRRVYWLIG